MRNEPNQTSYNPSYSPLLSYTRSALAILRTSVELARGERAEFYRVAAVQLRLLLCDTTRRHGRVVEIALLPQVMAELRLHPLGEGGEFELGQVPLPLGEWLEQRLPGGLSIRQLIRRVCDQDGGAHVDVKPQAGLGGMENHPDWIIRIGEYVLKRLEGM